jgi:hypothetical protein
MVPKVMNFFWVEGVMSWARYMSVYSFCKMNPGWTVRVYLCPLNDFTEKGWVGPQLQDYFKYEGADYFPRMQELPVDIRQWEVAPPKGDTRCDWVNALSCIQKSDIFTWYILHEEGGFYSDMDILYIKPIDAYYEEIQDCDVTMCYTSDARHFSIGFLAAQAGNTLYRDVWRYSFDAACSNPQNYQGTGVIALYAWGAISQECAGRDIRHNALSYYQAAYPKSDLRNIPMDVVYPFRWNGLHALWDERREDVVEKKGSIGIHWFGGDAISQVFNNRLNEDTVHTIDNTFTHYARQML